MPPLRVTWRKATPDGFELSLEGGSVVLLATQLRPDPSEPDHVGDLELRSGPKGERGFVALVAVSLGLELGPSLASPGPLSGVRGNIRVSGYRPSAPFDAKLTLDSGLASGDSVRDGTDKRDDDDECVEIYFNLDESGAFFATKDEHYDQRVIELFARGLRDGRVGAAITRAPRPDAASLDEIFTLACRGTDTVYTWAMDALDRSVKERGSAAFAAEVPVLVKKLAGLRQGKASRERRDGLASGRGILTRLAHAAAAHEYVQGLNDGDESVRRDALVSLDLQSHPGRIVASFLDQPNTVPPIVEALDRYISHHVMTAAPGEIKRAVEIRARLAKR